MANKELITAANWRIHPNNQWSFQNIEKLFATEVIKKNHKKQSVFSSNLSKIDAIEFVNLEEKKTNRQRDAYKWLRRFLSCFKKRRDNF